MSYIENPKTAGSGVVCAIPQVGRCPINCDDCFFQSGRSYLEPLDENLPNMPELDDAQGRVVRVNDGLDSNVDRDLAIMGSRSYGMRFFNTSIPKDLESFPGPVVLTVNPGGMTDKAWHRVDPIPPNLMFVRVRMNTWNVLDVVDHVVEYYTARSVPVVLTFMAYYTGVESIPEKDRDYYELRKRTMNAYWVLKPQYWRELAGFYRTNRLVSTCGKNPTEHACRYCGNCLREYFATMERMRK